MMTSDGCEDTDSGGGFTVVDVVDDISDVLEDAATDEVTGVLCGMDI